MSKRRVNGRIDLLDDEASLSEADRWLLHVLATAEKNELQSRDESRKTAIQDRIAGKKNHRERNHKLFLAAGLMIEAGLVDSSTGELKFDQKKLLVNLKWIRSHLETL